MNSIQLIKSVSFLSLLVSLSITQVACQSVCSWMHESTVTEQQKSLKRMGVNVSEEDIENAYPEWRRKN